MAAAPTPTSPDRKQRLSLEGAEGAQWHIPDLIRVGVLCCNEEAELRLAAHMLSCPTCREPQITLAEAAVWVKPSQRGRKMSCAEARNEIFHLLEEGKGMSHNAVVHLNRCEGCRDHLLEPAKLAYAHEVDDSAIAAQD
jgi:hypothetical protein